MRVITGKYKGRRFEVPKSFKARPTTDFAKENLFNVLRSYTDFDGISALDLFAGTGSITIELLSRGCGRVVSVERDAMHHAFICSVLRHLDDRNAKVLRADVLKFVQKCPERFDLIFADPPYALRELSELPDMVLGSGLLNDGGLFVLEHGKTNDFSQHPLFREHRSYGSVNFSFFTQTSTPDQ